MYRLTTAVRSSQSLLSQKALASTLKANAYFNREFHWFKKSDGKKKEKLKKEEKTEKDRVEDDTKSVINLKKVEENKKPQETMTNDAIKATAVVESEEEMHNNHYEQFKEEFDITELEGNETDMFNLGKADNVTIAKFDLSNKNVSFNDVFKMLVSEDQSRFEPNGITYGSPLSKMGLTPIPNRDTPSPSTDDLIVPIIPLPLRPLFPGFVQSILISDRRTVQKLKEINSSRKPYVGLFLRKEMTSNNIRDSPDVIRDISELHNVGTFAEIRSFQMQGTIANLVLLGRNRIHMDELVSLGPPTMAKVSKIIHPNPDFDEITYKAYANEVFSYSRKLVVDNPLLNDYMTQFLHSHEPNNPVYFADFAGGLTTDNRELQQRLLETESYSERLEIAIQLLLKERAVSKLQRELTEQIQKKTKETEKNFILREQLKVIQTQLGGDKDPKTLYIDKVNKTLKTMREEKVNPAAITAVEEELTRLSYTDIQSAEFGIIRNYIDWITCLPWNKQGADQMNLLLAEKVLNEDHYGLKDVKDRILEFIAVGKLQGNIPGKVLCFVGPPGTGKTSIAKSIARALGREYFQFSVGGANDVSQIKGHRRTYVGSMPGKLIHCLKKTNVNNPLILIDEVDKISASHQGDPASALLEVLDPNQNTQFVDNYLDVPVDFSKALFVCTANDISTIPQPLLDRMEIIRVSGYDYKEKLEISKNYLDKKARKATGLERTRATTPKSLTIADDAYESLIRWYCREAGVRNLEKYIEKIYRKVAMRLAKMSPEEIAKTDFTIHDKDLEPYIGKKIFLSDRLYDSTPAGVVMGLAWTSMGGATLYIECQTTKPHPLDTDLAAIMKRSNVFRVEEDKPATTTVGHLSMTGQLGDVMKESIQIAYINARHWMQKLSYSTPLYDALLRSFNAEKAITSVVPSRNQIFDILETSDIHMHLPEGATPKDGPSAGCAITTSLLSTALHRPIKQGLAMTGEISLNGKVLPVGGIKEKVMAARRAGINEIILPAENVRDVNELPDYIKENLTIHYAKTYEDVLQFTELCPEIFNCYVC